MDSISKISGQLQGTINPVVENQKTKANEFQNVLGNALNEVNETILDAGQKSQKLAHGEVADIHEVMIASQKASVSLEMVIEIRNKLVDSYREMMRMQV